MHSPSPTLQIEPQGWSVPVAPGQSLLEAAQAAGIRLPRSCRNGSCRACRCKLLQGQVHYRIEWPGLLAEEKAEGWILPCVALPEDSGAAGIVVIEHRWPPRHSIAHRPREVTPMFTALMLTQQNKQTQAAFVNLDEAALPTGDVRVRVDYSSLNYKDALAITGRGAIVRSWPMVPGIDLAGIVEHSDDAAWREGDRVVVNGWGLGETAWGGLAQKASLKAGWLLRLPERFSTRDAMAVATAGYTAALCVMALQRHGLKAGDGEVLVTGATGGVGSVAVALLAGLGCSVTALTGKPRESDYLHAMGARHILDRSELTLPGKPLQSERWTAVVDTVGSHVLVNALAQTRWNGAVAACGLAGGSDLPGTVMPFILRGVTLYGINCVLQPNPVREQAWALLAEHLKPAQLTQMTQEVALSDVMQASNDLLAGRIRGRTVVDVNR